MIKHNFHIPVMGVGFSVDTPLKVAKYGISSVVAIVNDNLIEEVRKYYCKLFNIEYVKIEKSENDSRAKRIQYYFDMIQDVVKKQINEMKNNFLLCKEEVIKYFSMLPDISTIKTNFFKMLNENYNIVKNDLMQFIDEYLQPGDICANIMTKIDKDNYNGNEKLEKEFSDALSILRGFANSKGKAKIVFSAGFNRRLYSYLENFDCFYPDKNGIIEKEVILKISDYRSALTQAKFLASKGIWISEFRLESGLNCSGHAFPVDGKLVGPILQELKDKREELINTIFPVYKEYLQKNKGININHIPQTKWTYQGGVKNSKEHNFLLSYYKMDSIGWGAPFMFVPEVINISNTTLNDLIKAKWDDLYISTASPLGVPYNALKSNLDINLLYHNYLENNYGYNCSFGYLKNNTEFTDKPICTASREYMEKKINQIKEKKLPEKEEEKEIKNVLSKFCLCVDLAKTKFVNYKLDVNDNENKIYSICCGKSASFFDRSYTLKEMIDHIYGRKNITINDNSSTFLNDMKVTLEYLKNNISNMKNEEIENYIKNINDGIDYYLENINDFKDFLPDRMDLEKIKDQIKEFVLVNI